MLKYKNNKEIAESEQKMLNGFEIISENERSEECMATINATGMTFSGQTVLNFKTPEYVMFGVNKQTKQLGIAACEDGKDARAFCKAGDAKSARINFGSYREAIAEMVPDWDFESFNYRVNGTFSEDHTEMIFDLLAATPKAKRSRSKKESLAVEEPAEPTEVVESEPQPTEEPTA